jgi:hypothetical protein
MIFILNNMQNENEIKCKEFLEEFVNQYINWEEGKCLVPTQANVEYLIEKSLNNSIIQQTKLSVNYNGVIQSKVVFGK